MPAVVPIITAVAKVAIPVITKYAIPAAATYFAAKSSSSQEKAASKAMEAAKAAGDTAAGAQLEMFYKSLELQEPWRQAGLEALPRMKEEAFGPYTLSRQYRLASGELEKGLGRFASKTGATGAATEQYSRGLERLLAMEEDRYYNRLAGLAGYGQQAAGAGAGAAMQTGGTLADIYYGTGQQVGQGLYQQGAARGSFYSGLAGLPFQMASTYALNKYASGVGGQQPVDWSKGTWSYGK